MKKTGTIALIILTLTTGYDGLRIHHLETMLQISQEKEVNLQKDYQEMRKIAERCLTDENPTKAGEREPLPSMKRNALRLSDHRNH